MDQQQNGQCQKGPQQKWAMPKRATTNGPRQKDMLPCYVSAIKYVWCLVFARLFLV